MMTHHGNSVGFISYIRVIQLCPFFLLPFLSVAHRRLAVVVALRRARVSFRRRGS